MKKSIVILIWLSVALLIILNFFLIAKMKIERKEHKYMVNALEKRQTDYIELFKRDLYLFSQDIVINNDVISKLQETKNFNLIYVYRNNECSKCLMQDIGYVREYTSKINSARIVIFPVFENSRNNNIILEADLKGLNYFRLNKEQIKSPEIQGYHVRFFALLTPSGKIILPFFPNADFPERTEEYLNYITNAYLKN